MSVTKIIKLEKSDFMKFNLYFAKKSLILLPFIMFIISYAIINELGLLGLLELTISLIIGFIIAPIFFIISLYIFVNKYFKSYSLASMQVETTIDGNGITHKSELGNTILPFDKIYKISETKHAFYVFTSNRQAMVLPKRFFNIDSENKEIREIFINNMDKKKLNLKK